MSAPSPRPRLRPPPPPAPTTDRRQRRERQADQPGPPGAPPGRTVPGSVLALLGLVVPVALALLRPTGPGAVTVLCTTVGVGLAATVPGTVLQRRYLPGLQAGAPARWALRAAVSLLVWTLAAAGVVAAGVRVASPWPVLAGSVVLAAVVLAAPSGCYGRWSPAAVGRGGVAVLAGLVVAAVGAGLLWSAATPPAAGGAGADVVVSFVDPAVPFALSATGARASAAVRIANPGADAVTVQVGGRVGSALPWPTQAVTVPAGATRVVTVAGPVPVCSDPQQVVVTLDDAADLAPLSAVLPGAVDGTRCFVAS